MSKKFSSTLIILTKFVKCIHYDIWCATLEILPWHEVASGFFFSILYQQALSLSKLPHSQIYKTFFQL